MTMKTDAREKQATMKTAFAARLTDKIEDLEQAAEPIARNDSHRSIAEALAAVQALAHKLTGSAGTYGFGVISHTARNLELLCLSLLAETEPFSAAELTQVSALLSLMREEAKTSTDFLLAQPQQNERVAGAADYSGGKRKKLILVDDDAEQSQMLEQLLNNFGYAVLVLEHPSALQGAIAELPPDAIIMDIMFPDDPDAGLTTINELREENILDCPVVFISVREDFPARLEAIRGGSDGFIVKPIDINNLVETLNRLITEGDKPAHRVLIVDDDKDLTEFCRVVLEAAGMQIRTVNDPMMATEEMIGFGPDVILLDIEMPACNGFELASVIRQMDDNYLQIPILYLTAHAENSKQMLAARTGSEDFIAKPVDAERLLASVLARCERSRILKALYHRLLAGEERFGSITRSANEAVVSADSLGLVLSWNVGAERIFGYKKREIIGRPLTTLMPQRYRRAHSEGFKRFCGGEKPKFIGKTIELSGLRKDGKEFPLDLSLQSWRSESGPFFAATMRDITERKETEAALKRAKEEADNANNAKSEFLSSMSHELRTPLNSILGFAQLLQFNPMEPLTKTQDSSVELIIKGGNHLLELINDILDLAKIEAGKIEINIEDISIMAVAEECLALISDMAEKGGVEIEIEEPATDIGLVRADLTGIKQVLLNLLSNAIKYNRNGGKVAIHIEDSDLGIQRISVIDNGLGIAEELHGYLFQPFSRLGAENSEIEGTGIGLVVCKKLVQSMLGSIGMESRQGHGSTFWFELPSSTTPENRPEDGSAGPN